jgi:hypothetical protein
VTWCRFWYDEASCSIRTSLPLWAGLKLPLPPACKMLQLAHPHQPGRCTIATRFVKNIHSLGCGLAINQGWWPLIEAYLQAHVRQCLASFEAELAEDGLGGIIKPVLETLGHGRKDVKPELHTPLLKLGLPCFTKVVDVSGDALVLCLDKQGVEAAREHRLLALTEVRGIAVWQRWGCIGLPWQCTLHTCNASCRELLACPACSDELRMFCASSMWGAPPARVNAGLQLRNRCNFARHISGDATPPAV